MSVASLPARRAGRPRVVLTHWVHPEVIARLAATCDVIANDTRAGWPREHLVAQLRESDAAMMFMPDTVDDALLAACPRLAVIAAALKGIDNFDVEACTRRRVWLTRVPDLLTVPTAELAIALMLGLGRHLLAGDDHVRSGTFAGWRPQLYGSGLAGATVGLIGFGAVGRAIARRLAAFDARVLYADPVATDGPAERVSVEALLAASDYVLPLTHLERRTLHMIDARALARMRPGALLVNVGRGSLVDEAAVAASLAGGRLAGYAADVFEMEDWARVDRPRAIHAALLADRARTLFTPHLGSAVDDVRRSIALEAAESILDVFAGRRPRGAVNDAESPTPRGGGASA